jgi:uncharacterized protein YunC (DUF1805 family)
MMETREISVDGKKVVGVRVALHPAPLVLLVASRGYVMCGYLNLDTAEKLEQAAAVVRGVKTFEDVLKAKIVATTSGAKALGVRAGMRGREALERMA